MKKLELTHRNGVKYSTKLSITSDLNVTLFRGRIIFSINGLGLRPLKSFFEGLPETSYLIDCPDFTNMTVELDHREFPLVRVIED